MLLNGTMSNSGAEDVGRTFKYTMEAEPGARLKALYDALSSDGTLTNVTTADGDNVLSIRFNVQGPEAGTDVQTLANGQCTVWRSAPRILEYQYDCRLIKEPLHRRDDSEAPEKETKKCIMTDTVRFWVSDHADNRALVDEWAMSKSMKLEGMLEAAANLAGTPGATETADIPSGVATVPLTCLPNDDEEADALSVWVGDSYDQVISDYGDKGQDSGPKVICVPVSFQGDNKRFTVEMEIEPAPLAQVFEALQCAQ